MNPENNHGRNAYILTCVVVMVVMTWCVIVFD
jgi:hypothetical protein